MRPYTRPRTIFARHLGACVGCHFPILSGQRITTRPGLRGWVHDSCVDSNANVFNVGGGKVMTAFETGITGRKYIVVGPDHSVRRGTPYAYDVTHDPNIFEAVLKGQVRTPRTDDTVSLLCRTGKCSWCYGPVLEGELAYEAADGDTCHARACRDHEWRANRIGDGSYLWERMAKGSTLYADWVCDYGSKDTLMPIPESEARRVLSIAAVTNADWLDECVPSGCETIPGQVASDGEHDDVA